MDKDIVEYYSAWTGERNPTIRNMYGPRDHYASEISQVQGDKYCMSSFIHGEETSRVDGQRQDKF